MTSKKVSKVVSSVKNILNQEDMSPAVKEAIGELFNLVTVLVNQVGLNSANSSKPPSSDPYRARRQSRMVDGKKRKSGAQVGHKGSRLSMSEKPDVVEQLFVDKRTLPAGKYESAGFESRQVFDIEVSFKVTEYQAEILRDKNGVEYIADFPAGVTEKAQYGNAVKATSVYILNSRSLLLPTNFLNSQPP